MMERVQLSCVDHSNVNWSRSQHVCMKPPLAVTFTFFCVRQTHWTCGCTHSFVRGGKWVLPNTLNLSNLTDWILHSELSHLVFAPLHATPVVPANHPAAR